MKRHRLCSLVLSIVGITCISPAIASPGFKDTSESVVSGQVPIERIPVKASLLSLDMTREQVEQIMGKPTIVKVFPNVDIQLITLSYLEESLVTLVSFANGKVTAITVQMKVVTDSNLPSFASEVTVGMTRSELVQVLGEPVDAQQSSLGTMQIERLIFRKNEQSLRVLLSDGRVEAFNQQLERPERLLKVGLPGLVENVNKPATVQIGMSLEQAKVIFGKPDFEQYGIYQEQKTQSLVYVTLSSNESRNLLFINGVLTRYTKILASSL
jgi:outer membrane protein assembly factor BamE (lipoprotein component of BamABCDE complex)